MKGVERQNQEKENNSPETTKSKKGTKNRVVSSTSLFGKQHVTVPYGPSEGRKKREKSKCQSGSAKAQELFETEEKKRIQRTPPGQTAAY